MTAKLLGLGAAMGLGLAFLVFSPDAKAQQKLCPGLTGQERTSCLRAELARTQAETARWNAYVASLDRDIERACAVAALADTVSQVKGGREGMAYDTGRRIGDAATRGGATKACDEAKQRRKAAKKQ